MSSDYYGRERKNITGFRGKDEILRGGSAATPRAVPGEIPRIVANGSSLSSSSSSYSLIPLAWRQPHRCHDTLTCRPRRLRIFGSSITEGDFLNEKQSGSWISQPILRSVLLSPGAWIESSSLLLLPLLHHQHHLLLFVLFLPPPSPPPPPPPRGELYHKPGPTTKRWSLHEGTLREETGWRKFV